MQRLLVIALALGLIVSACGSGDELQPTATETSQRAQRQATALEQEEPQLEAVAEVDEPTASAQPDEQAQAEQAQTDQQIDAPQDDNADQQVVVLPEEIVGEHKGIRSERHVLGDPDSPVEILYYGDFT